jgi:hypothetical protein
MMTNISRDISDLRQHCLGSDRETGNRSGVLQRRANYLRGIEDAHGYRIAELASGRFVVEASRAGRERTATHLALSGALYRQAFQLRAGASSSGRSIHANTHRPSASFSRQAMVPGWKASSGRSGSETSSNEASLPR